MIKPLLFLLLVATFMFVASLSIGLAQDPEDIEDALEEYDYDQCPQMPQFSLIFQNKSVFGYLSLSCPDGWIPIIFFDHACKTSSGILR